MTMYESKPTLMPREIVDDLAKEAFNSLEKRGTKVWLDIAYVLHHAVDCGVIAVPCADIDSPPEPTELGKRLRDVADEAERRLLPTMYASAFIGMVREIAVEVDRQAAEIASLTAGHESYVKGAENLFKEMVEERHQKEVYQAECGRLTEENAVLANELAGVRNLNRQGVPLRETTTIQPLRCIFCSFTGETLESLKEHSAECEGHPLKRIVNGIAERLQDVLRYEHLAYLDGSRRAARRDAHTILAVTGFDIPRPPHPNAYAETAEASLAAARSELDAANAERERLQMKIDRYLECIEAQKKALGIE